MTPNTFREAHARRIRRADWFHAHEETIHLWLFRARHWLEFSAILLFLVAVLKMTGLL